MTNVVSWLGSLLSCVDFLEKRTIYPPRHCQPSYPDVFFQTTNLVLSERFHPTNSQNKLFLEDNDLQSLSLEESMTSVVARASATKRRSKAVELSTGGHGT